MKAKLRVPTELNDISLKQYQEFLKAIDGIENVDLIKQRTIEHFCEIPLSNVLLIQMKDVREICTDIDLMFSNPEKPLHQTFKIKDVEFGMIPNLEEMSFGEYVDLDNYVTDWQQMHKAMAVLFRPITSKVGDKYEIEEYTGTKEAHVEIMQFAPLGVVMGAMVFFYSLGNELLKATKDYLTQETLDLISPLNNNSAKDGDGIQQFMHSQQEMLRSLIELLDNPLEVV